MLGFLTFLICLFVLAVPTACQDCDAGDSLETCLQLPGCRWFSYTGDCPICEQVFGEDPVSVTGCRPVSKSDYCASIFSEAQAATGANPAEPWFRDVVRHFEIHQGSGEAGNPFGRTFACSVWCDYSEPMPCFGQPRTKHDIRGVNYGGRFIPEEYLGMYGTSEFLTAPGSTLNPSGMPWSLCELDGPDAGERMSNFLDANIQEDHFVKMAELGFNVVRLPLGYWNLMSLGGNTPNGPPDVAIRWSNLLNMMDYNDYRKWIDLIFQYAGDNGLQVLLDLHSVPGQQTGNQDTGCTLANEGDFYFVTDWNLLLGRMAVVEMAKLCTEYGETCFGIEIINEPFTFGAEANEQDFPRDTLAQFYSDAIMAAREVMDVDKPIVLMEYPERLNYWQQDDVPHFSYAEYGRVMFSTHVYEFPAEYLTEIQSTRDSFVGNLDLIQNFFETSGYDIFVSEYGLNSHGSGGDDDEFDYDSFVNWFVHQCDARGIGSMIWNYDSYYPAWGPVANAHVGTIDVEWKRIFDPEDADVSRFAAVAAKFVRLLRFPLLIMVFLVALGVAVLRVPTCTKVSYSARTSTARNLRIGGAMPLARESLLSQ